MGLLLDSIITMSLNSNGCLIIIIGYYSLPKGRISGLSIE